jgi:thiol-disulfide isomerase/thioredoxin
MSQGLLRGDNVLNRRTFVLLAVLALAAGLAVMSSIRTQQARAGDLADPQPTPAFTHTDPQDWINSEPLALEDLRGKVVLIDFWTFDCWNCYRSFPWLTSLEQRFSDAPFVVLGVHAPEFSHERRRDNVVGKTREFGLHHPVMIDNDFSFWRAMGNRYWPTFYLLDKQGRVRARFIGETHEGDRNARAVESKIHELLAEPAA